MEVREHRLPQGLRDLPDRPRLPALVEDFPLRASRRLTAPLLGGDVGEHGADAPDQAAGSDPHGLGGQPGDPVDPPGHAQGAVRGPLAQDDVVQHLVEAGQAVGGDGVRHVGQGRQWGVVRQSEDLAEPEGGLHTVVPEVPLRPARAHQSLGGGGHAMQVARLPVEQQLVAARADPDLGDEPHRTLRVAGHPLDGLRALARALTVGAVDHPGDRRPAQGGKPRVQRRGPPPPGERAFREPLRHIGDGRRVVTRAEGVDDLAVVAEDGCQQQGRYRKGVEDLLSRRGHGRGRDRCGGGRVGSRLEVGAVVAGVGPDASALGLQQPLDRPQLQAGTCVGHRGRWSMGARASSGAQREQ